MDADVPGNTIDVFFSYSHRDEQLRDELAKQLKLLERQGAIRSWHDRAIGAGSEWRDVIDERLMNARIILLLISADFLASDYCFDVEMKAALARHDRKEATVVPVIVRPVDWETSPFGRLQALPTDGKPITTYSNQDAAFKEIAIGIRRLVDGIRHHNSGVTTSGSIDRARASRKVESLLPVTASSPLLLGFAIDVSGSMQESVRNAAGPDQNRLQAVLQSIKRLTGAGADWRQDPQLAAGSDLVKVFAYGFGFADRAADYGELASLANRFLGASIPSQPATVHRGGVRDLLELAGLGQHALPLKVLGERWSQVEERLWDQRFDLFGDTPMRRAMIAVRTRFEDESKSYRGRPRSLLVVVSDGESTDGSALEDSRAIADLGTTIIGAYLTSTDISTTRRLYEVAPESWPTGAKTLFEMCSSMGEDGPSFAALRSKGWVVTANSRLFLQVNQSEIMSEFVEAVVAMQTTRAVG